MSSDSCHKMIFLKSLIIPLSHVNDQLLRITSHSGNENKNTTRGSAVVCPQ